MIECDQFVNSIYQIVLKLDSQDYSDKFFSAFNGRYFRDDVISEQSVLIQNEIMHTIYLSDLLEVQSDLDKFDMNMEY